MISVSSPRNSGSMGKRSYPRRSIHKFPRPHALCAKKTYLCMLVSVWTCEGGYLGGRERRQNEAPSLHRNAYIFRGSGVKYLIETVTIFYITVTADFDIFHRPRHE